MMLEANSRRRWTAGLAGGLVFFASSAFGRGSRSGGSGGGSGGGGIIGGLIGLGFGAAIIHNFFERRADTQWHVKFSKYAKLAEEYGCSRVRHYIQNEKIVVTLWMEVHNVTFTVAVEKVVSDRGLAALRENLQRILNENDAKGRRRPVYQLHKPPPRSVKIRSNRA